MKKLQEQIEFLESFQGLVEAYQQVAATRMRKVRDSVLAKRQFLEEIAAIFKSVKSSYEREIRKLMKKKKVLRGQEVGKLTLLQRNGRTALVLLSSNTGLYGDVVRDSFNLFLQAAVRSEGDPVVIGAYGKLLFDRAMPGVEYTYFDFPDNVVTLANLSWVMEHLVRYKRVLVFYGQFKNLVRQEAVVSSVSGDEVETVVASEEMPSAPATEYLFEPSLEEIMVFFESEILALLFEQTVAEAQLSKFASRMLSMERANENVEEKISNASFLQLRFAHYENNKKQLQRLAGSMVWRRT